MKILNQANLEIRWSGSARKATNKHKGQMQLQVPNKAKATTPLLTVYQAAKESFRSPVSFNYIPFLEYISSCIHSFPRLDVCMGQRIFCGKKLGLQPSMPSYETSIHSLI